jgi:exportin-1
MAPLPHINLISRAQIETFVRGLFDLNQDLTTFKAHLRDFLISLKEFAGDSQELYLEELELEQERKRKADMEAAMKIPGLVKPMDRPDDLSD